VNPAPVWLLPTVVEAIHDEQITEHGGAAGVRDRGLLESSLARPLNRWAYRELNLFVLAAAYAFAIVKNHPFVDGNKRTAFLAAYLFLRLNGWRVLASQDEVVRNVLSLASGEEGDTEFAQFLEANALSIP
jgi:death-on-curing protein